MTENNISEAEVPNSAAVERQISPPPRILVADDESSIRRLMTASLVHSGYEVDAAEDGAAAWEALQARRYDLLITDNSMPKVTGVELIKRLRGQGGALPVVMVSGAIPTADLEPHPQLGISAIILKPFSLGAFLDTVQNVLRAAAVIVVLLLWLPAAGNAQEVKPAAEVQHPFPDSVAQPNAVAISVVGKCECSADGVTFTNFESGHIFEQGAVVRTGEDARTDLFFRRTGTTVRLQPGTEMAIEKMAVTMKDGLPAVHTLLDLHSGRVFIVVRSAVAGSTLEIRNAAGRSVVEGSGIGRYIITADGSHVSANGSAIPLKVIGENGITIIAAGEQFASKDGKMLPASPSLWVKDLIQLDELQASTEGGEGPSPKP
jgi:CheY-like chemotaxis protein